MLQADIQASDYIGRLWGKRRREFARRYWAFLVYEQPKPELSDYFGADRIKDHLIDIKQTWERDRGWNIR